MITNLTYYKQLINHAWSPDNWTFNKGTIQGYHSINTEVNTLYIVFNCTNSNEDIKVHFECIPKKLVVPYDNMYSKIRAHDGWLKEYKQAGIRDYIHNIVFEFLQENVEGTVCVMGYSYGGATAQLCAIDIQYNFNCKIKCIMFSSPRAGNKYFVNSFSKRVPEHFNFIYGTDIVPYLPPRIFGYRFIKNTKHLHKRKFLTIVWNTLKVLYLYVTKQLKEPITQALYIIKDHIISQYEEDEITII